MKSIVKLWYSSLSVLHQGIDHFAKPMMFFFLFFFCSTSQLEKLLFLMFITMFIFIHI